MPLVCFQSEIRPIQRPLGPVVRRITCGNSARYAEPGQIWGVGFWGVGAVVVVQVHVKVIEGVGVVVNIVVVGHRRRRSPSSPSSPSRSKVELQLTFNLTSTSTCSSSSPLIFTTVVVAASVIDLTAVEVNLNFNSTSTSTSTSTSAEITDTATSSPLPQHTLPPQRLSRPPTPPLPPIHRTIGRVKFAHVIVDSVPLAYQRHRVFVTPATQRRRVSPAQPTWSNQPPTRATLSPSTRLSPVDSTGVTAHPRSIASTTSTLSGGLAQHRPSVSICTSCTPRSGEDTLSWLYSAQRWRRDCLSCIPRSGEGASIAAVFREAGVGRPSNHKIQANFREAGPPQPRQQRQDQFVGDPSQRPHDTSRCPAAFRAANIRSTRSGRFKAIVYAHNEFADPGGKESNSPPSLSLGSRLSLTTQPPALRQVDSTILRHLSPNATRFRLRQVDSPALPVASVTATGRYPYYIPASSALNSRSLYSHARRSKFSLQLFIITRIRYFDTSIVYNRVAQTFN
ncbi:hypothetical protein R3P38DRAFT_2774149 [Favolaschia claudopus]|uniref:Uncharacterized protein n=1 Tax=Favolaschia claudopus TaxID=2862362 RepID=A0AAW0BY75_9AGAR